MIKVTFLISDKKKIDLSINDVETTAQLSEGKEIKLDVSHTKINFKWIKDLNVNVKTSKFQKKTGTFPGVGKIFLTMTQSPEEKKTLIDQNVTKYKTHKNPSTWQTQ